jgi:hypothetical protein
MPNSGGISTEASPGDEIASDGSLTSPANGAPPAKQAYSRAILQLGCVMLGYIGVYLCRKNFAVAVPLIQTAFHANKAQVGAIDSYATMAYMFGKLFWGPLIVDRVGGKICFFVVLFGVAIFGGLSAFAISLPMLGFLYMANRFFGAGGWESMVKLVPDWFPSRHLALAMAFLSLSFVFGGVCAVLLAGQIAFFSGDNWRVVMGFPSLILLAIIGICWLVLRKEKKPAAVPDARSTPWHFSRILLLFKIPQFWIVCGLSFILTITRETFNVWTVASLPRCFPRRLMRWARWEYYCWAGFWTGFHRAGGTGCCLPFWRRWRFWFMRCQRSCTSNFGWWSRPSA